MQLSHNYRLTGNNKDQILFGFGVGIPDESFYVGILEQVCFEVILIMQ